MNYDSSFDQTRLDQLASQCLSDNTSKGKVIFLSDAEDNCLDVASWRFEDDSGMERLIKGEFKGLLMELLSQLMVYRAQHQQPNSRQGVVFFDGEQMSLSWITRDEAEELRNIED